METDTETFKRIIALYFAPESKLMCILTIRIRTKPWTNSRLSCKRFFVYGDDEFAESVCHMLKY